MSHNKRIETSRECRLWIVTGTTVIATVLMVASNPVIRDFVETRVEDIKYETRRIKEKFKNKRKGS